MTSFTTLVGLTKEIGLKGQEIMKFVQEQPEREVRQLERERRAVEFEQEKELTELKLQLESPNESRAAQLERFLQH